jgi:7-keto-8-aminopelargonate synthetase-like enzyme
LDKIVALAEKYEAAVYVDDAHGTGILGETGRGTAEMFGVSSRIHFHMGTFSKGLCGLGGFIAADRTTTETLRVVARTSMFQTPLPPDVCARNIAALRLIQQEPWRRQQLLSSAALVRRELERQGYNTLGTKTQIIPVLIGDERLVPEVTHHLISNCVFAPCYYYPAVPKGQAIIRLNVVAGHTGRQLDQALEAITSCSAVGRNIDSDLGHMEYDITPIRPSNQTVNSSLCHC